MHDLNQESQEQQSGSGIVTKAGLAAAAGLTAFLSGCATTSSRATKAETELESALGAPISEQMFTYSSTALIPNTTGTLYGQNIDFFWSATCIYSARLFESRIVALLRDKTEAKRINVGLHHLCRNETDVQYFVRMRQYNEFTRLCSGWLQTMAQHDRVLKPEDVDGLAQHMKLSKRRNYDPADAARAARLASHYFNRTMKIDQTPTTRLNGRTITFS